MTKLLLIIIMMLLITTSFCILYIASVKQFNNGICKKCGGKMKYFDTDSQGSDGYMCEHCGNTVWQSWYKPKEK